MDASPRSRTTSRSDNAYARRVEPASCDRQDCGRPKKNALVSLPRKNQGTSPRAHNEGGARLPYGHIFRSSLRRHAAGRSSTCLEALLGMALVFGNARCAISMTAITYTPSKRIKDWLKSPHRYCPRTYSAKIDCCRKKLVKNRRRFKNRHSYFASGQNTFSEGKSEKRPAL